MKKIVSVQSWHDIEVTIGVEDVQVIFDHPDDGSLKAWLIQLNDVAIFLKGTPESLLQKLSPNQARVIHSALNDICERILSQCPLDPQKKLKS